MRRTPLFEATGYFRPFPDAHDVFSADVETHAQYLLPLASADLSHIAPNLNGTIHFIQPIEPYDGVVGQGSERCFNYLCRENWVGYQYSGDKCRLATNFEFFQFADLNADEKPSSKRKKQLQTLTEHYSKVRRGFELRRAHFHEHGALHNAWARKRNGVHNPKNRVELVKRLGGPSYSGNWSEAGNFPLTRGSVTDAEGEEWTTAVPKSEDDRDFLFIGQLSAFHYIAESPDFTCALDCDLLVFYDPVAKVALTTFDWS
jgi:hypothetical protein